MAQTDSTEIKLQRYKDMFVKGLINSSEYDILRRQTLGIEDKPVTQKEAIAPIDAISEKSFSSPQLILCKNANKENCNLVTPSNEFKRGGGGTAHVCCVIKGILKTSVLKIRIRLHHHKDIEFTISDYTPSNKPNCVYQDIVIYYKGKHEIEILDDKDTRILIGAFVVR